MADKYVPRMRQRYDDVVIKAMQEKFGYTNPMQVPALDKVVINMGVGEAARGALVAPDVVVQRAVPSAFDDGAGAQSPVDFRRFALNGLLAPLIDDAEPPRWTEVALEYMCDPQTQVSIDGQPLIPGSLLPERAFLVRWNMNHCEPFGQALALSGIVDIYVSPEPRGMSALISPDRLQIHSSTGRSTLQGSFRARLVTVAEVGVPQ